MSGVPAAPFGDRFWERTRRADNGCLEWTGYRSPGGYGRVCYRARSRSPIMAHRVAWELAHGPIPDGMSVLHRCDNRPCVNPDHLFLGTYADNVADMHAKGRARKASRPGMANHMAKLSDADVARIRATIRPANGRRLVPSPAVALSREFGVSRTLIYRIAFGQAWRHVA